MLTVVLSLDTELAWGRLSSDKERPLFADPSHGRNAFRFILDELDKHDVPATWGIVGHLLLDSCTTDSHYSAPHIDTVDPYSNKSTDPLYYAPEIVHWIQNASTDHEVAGHSFSHPRFSNLDREQAREELAAMIEVFTNEGIELKSMIHPGIDLQHRDLLPEFGIQTYSEAGVTRNYTLKEGLPLLLKRDPSLLSVPPVEPFEDEYGLTAIPRSQSLRDERWGWLNPCRIKHALRTHDNGVLHLSFHPHNVIYDTFLKRTFSNVLKILADARSEGIAIIETFSELSSKYEC